MFTQFFGQYLLNNGIVNAQQLQVVFSKIKDARLRMGTIAINEGYLNSMQVEEINTLQKSHDKRFGEVAVLFNYISEDQLSDILGKQKSEHLLLGQTIVDLGYMSLGEFEEAIQVYKRHHGISDAEFTDLKDGKIDQVIYSMLDMENTAMKSFVTLFYKNIIRFITTDIHITDSLVCDEGAVFEHLFEQKIHGENGLYTAFTASDETLLAFASQYAGEKMAGVDDYTIDVCKEFLNLHNGLFTVNMSNEGIEQKLSIQNYQNKGTPECSKVYIIPMHTSLGDIQLMVGQL